MNRLFICEKDNQAKDIVEALSKKKGIPTRQENGAWYIGDDCFIGFNGHIFGLEEPDSYDERYKKWTLEDLPIIPEKFKKRPNKDKLRKVQLLRNTIKEAKEIINVGDAEREGQLIVDEAIIEMGIDPFSLKIKRMWIKSMIPDALVKYVEEELFQNKDKKTLFEAAQLREQTDWGYGMNLTRAYTRLAQNSGANLTVTIGRVQTPTLKLIVDRCREIKNFKPVDHYLPSGLFKHENGKFKADWVIPEDCDGVDANGRLIDKKIAEDVISKITGKTGKIDSFTSSNKSKAPPLLYALSDLQNVCNSKLGLTADETLSIAQSLYDIHKVITYPRTSSNYLTKDQTVNIDTIINHLSKINDISEISKNADQKIRTKVWNDKEVTDHFAIIPTTECQKEKIEKLNEKEKKVFLIIAKSYISQFYPDFTWKSLSALFKIEGETFKATGRQILAQGWKVVYGKEEKDDLEESEQTLPTMKKGDNVTAEKLEMLFKKTQPPPYFNDGTIILAMKNVHKYVKNENLKKILKENVGIGEESTRSNILNNLLKREYIVRNKNRLMSTQVGESIIDIVPQEISDPGLTALLEENLSKVEKGEMSTVDFNKILRKSIVNLVENAKKQGSVKIKGASLEALPRDGEICPRCGKGKLLTKLIRQGEMKGQRFLVCSAYNKEDEKSCKYAEFPESKKASTIKPLPGDGQICPKCGKGHMVTRVSKSGDKKFLACNNWRKDDPNSCSNIIWPETKSVSTIKTLPGDGQICPKCGKGHMVTRVSKSGDKKFLACNNWRKDDPNSCSNIIWPEEKKDNKSKMFSKKS